MSLNLPNNRRANESKFSQFHDEIFTMLALGYSQNSIFNQIKNDNPDLEISFNALRGYISRQKKNPKSRYNLSTEKQIQSNQISPEKNQQESIQSVKPPIKEKEKENTSNDFSSVENPSNSKPESPSEILKRKLGTTPPPKNDGFN